MGKHPQVILAMYFYLGQGVTQTAQNMQTRFQLREDSKERLPRPRFHSSLQTVAYAVTDILRK